MRSWLALDLGATKVACAVGSPSASAAGGVELSGSSVVAYPAASEAWLGDSAMVADAIAQAVEQAGAGADVTQAVVSARPPSLASEQIRSALVLGEEPRAIRARDVERLQAHALETVLGVDREALMVERLGCDGGGFTGVRDPRGLPTCRLIGAFHVVTMPIAARHALVRAVEAAGLDVAQVLYTLPAVFAGLPALREPARQVLLVDIGGLSSDIGLFLDGLCTQVRVVPWGGISAAGALARTLGVTPEQGAQWARQGTSCRNQDALAALQRQWTSLTHAIEAALTGRPRPEHLWLTGRGALSDGLVEWIERATGVPTSLARPVAGSALGDLARQMALSAAVGALTIACRAAAPPSASRHPRRLVNRLLTRAQSLLLEYF